jgi:spore coat polysaccharide biosynthesis protein SpsF (cytidylyltransferase family)
LFCICFLLLVIFQIIIVVKYISLKKEVKEIKDNSNNLLKEFKSKLDEWDKLFEEQHKIFVTMSLAYKNQLNIFEVSYKEINNGWKKTFEDLYLKYTKILKEAESVINYFLDRDLTDKNKDIQKH